MNSLNKDSGFTIFELVIVMTVLSILSMMVGWGVSSLIPIMRLKSAAVELKSNMQMARLYAIRHNTFVVSQFDVRNGHYIIFRDDGGGDITKANNYIKDDGEIVYKMVKVNPRISILRVKFGAVEGKFAFNSRGAIDGLAGGIYLSHKNNLYRGVTISRIGKITLKSSKDGSNWHTTN